MQRANTGPETETKQKQKNTGWSVDESLQESLTFPFLAAKFNEER